MVRWICKCLTSSWGWGRFQIARERTAGNRWHRGCAARRHWLTVDRQSRPVIERPDRCLAARLQREKEAAGHAIRIEPGRSNTRKHKAGGSRRQRGQSRLIAKSGAAFWMMWTKECDKAGLPPRMLTSKAAQPARVQRYAG